MSRIQNFSLALLISIIWSCSSQMPTSEPRPEIYDEPEAIPEQDIPPAQVLTGLDVMKSMGFKPLLGKRVGIVTNHTALTREGEHLVDLLAAAEGVTVAAIYAPEHGFRGNTEGGGTIQDGIDTQTGIRIYSLYGPNREPNAEMLQEIDILVYDIQDVGARFYTYISTMGYVLQAGARYDIPVMILDRPNPLGRKTGGNVLDPGFESFVGRYPIPIRYGLTIGELARMIIGERMLEDVETVSLHVVECEGWNGEYWQNTDLSWVAPSPNMRNTNETLTYPGLCLLEGVGISEGRGTEEPFEVVGTPYFNSELMIKELEKTGLQGFNLEPVKYTPVDMPGVAMNPIFEGEEVQGMRIQVTDPELFQPVEFLIHLLVTAKRHYPDKFSWRRSTGPDRLWGGDYLRLMIDANNSAEEIISMYQEELTDYTNTCSKYFIYPANR